MTRLAVLVLLMFGLACPQPAEAQMIGDSRASFSYIPPSAPSPGRAEAQPNRPDLGREAASSDVHRMVNWVAASGDNRRLPFLIVDKKQAKVFLFDARSQILGAAGALLGVGRGDDSVAGIGYRRLATMAPVERTTPAGRFEASLGLDLEQDVLWIDYDAALSLHRVIVGNPSDHRRERLASATPLDNRISYGCINVPVAFYDKLIVPAFAGAVGIVYILPETKPLSDVFAMDGGPARSSRAQP